MNRVSRVVLARVLIRSFAIQGSWNYRTLIGCGFAFALLPVLRALFAEPDAYRAAVQRHTTIFNSHPYLTPMALGAVTVLEATESPVVVERFKSAVRGSLGSLGDRLVWAGFRPVCILLALGAFLIGASWAWVTAGFLLVYNIGHVTLRIWALRFGLRHGRRLGEKLHNAPIDRIQKWLQHAGAFLLGLCLLLVLSGRPSARPMPWPWVLAATAAAAAGIAFGNRARLPVVLALAAFALFSIIAGALT